MGKTISATEAAHNFSELLDQIRLKRQRYTIMRGGKPVADLGPPDSTAPHTLGELLDLLQQLPSLGDDTDAFARDVERGRLGAPGTGG